MLTIGETARALGCSITTVRRLIGAGRLEAYKVAGITSPIRITEQSVDAILKASRLGPPPPVRPADGRRPPAARIYVDPAGDVFAA